MTESDLGPVIGGVEPVKPIRKLFRLHEAERAGRRAAGLSRGCAIGFAIVCGIVAVLLVLWMLAGLATRPAAAHGPAEWIQRGGYRNAAGELCCGERDCFELADGDVQVTPHGYFIKATKETVPFHEATPSPTGTYWRCYWGGKRKCFFAPPGSS